LIFGSVNTADSIDSAKMAQIIHKNLTVRGFNLPTVLPMTITQSLPKLMELIRDRKIRLLADSIFPLDKYNDAFTALNSRSSVGKVILAP
jgi:threonine dehydrogenase-like Zn-dependent dehydrogenase